MKASTTYEARAEKHSSEVARTLLTIAVQKKSNLCVSVDVTTKAALLRLVDAVGPHCCLIKTHIDILVDFDEDTITELQKLSARHNFLFFEDRKFADIGNTVQLQYAAGIYKIASWAHITNAHAVPGDGIVKGLKAVGSKLGQRGLLMLAEMSSAGNLASGDYSRQTLEMARRHKDFVCGFIAMHRIQDDYPDTSSNSDAGDEDFLVLTPGVGLDTKGDGMGQQYRTPQQVITESGCDIIIVGRGIYGSGEGHENMEETVKQAKRYQEAGWQAYLQRLA